MTELTFSPGEDEERQYSVWYQLPVVYYGSLLFCFSWLNLWLTILIICLLDQHFSVKCLPVLPLIVSYLCSSSASDVLHDAYVC